MKRDYLIFIPISLLCLISIVFLPMDLRIKQIIWIIIGNILFLLIDRISIKKILKYSELLYIICLILLILVLVLNRFTNGSRGWLIMGPISIQPSEIMKIALILVSLKYLNKINNYLFLLLYILPMVLIFLEPDTGAVIIIGIILLSFLKYQFNNKQLIKLFIIFSILVSFIITIYIFKPNIFIKVLGPNIFYRIDRIKDFQSNNNLQTTNALISIASGNTLYFPEMYNDFFIAYILSNSIYMIIPILLSTTIILLYLIKKNTIISQIAFNVLLWQNFWNMAMNLSLVPVIGIPYFFLSYGGTHIITTFILISLAIKKDDYMEHNHNKKIDNHQKVDYIHNMVG